MERLRAAGRRRPGRRPQGRRRRALREHARDGGDRARSALALRGRSAVGRPRQPRRVQRGPLGGPVRRGALLRPRPLHGRGVRARVPAEPDARRSDLPGHAGRALDLLRPSGGGGRNAGGHADGRLCVREGRRRVRPHRLPGPTLRGEQSPARRLRVRRRRALDLRRPGSPDSLPRHPSGQPVRADQRWSRVPLRGRIELGVLRLPARIDPDLRRGHQRRTPLRRHLARGRCAPLRGRREVDHARAGRLRARDHGDGPL